MSTEKVVLIAVTESTAQKIAFKEGGKVKAKAATKYLFKVEDGDVAPENITVKRVGNDLQVSFEGSEKPDLTIEGFFDQGMDGQLYGVSEDNLLYGYVRTDGEGFPGPLLMADGESAPLALGGQGVPYQATMVEAAGFALWPLLLGLAGLTAATAAIINHNKDGDGDDPKTSQAPTNLVATDDVGPVQGPLVNGDTTDDSHPVISGNGVPGAVIHVFDNGTEVGSTTVANDGTWTFTPNLPDGPHDIDVTQEVPGQKPSKPENVVDIVVDTIAPPAPKAELDPASDSGIKGDNITNDTTPTIDGKTEAGATVTVSFPSGESITAKADENGNWSVTPTKPLPEGKGDITVIATDTAGNESQPTVISVLIDTKAEQAKTWLDPNSDSGTKGDNLTNDTTPAIDGTSEPGATVIVTFPTGESVTAKADANGNWSVTPTKPLPEGKNDISVVVRDVAGNQSEPTVLSVAIDTQVPLIKVWLDPASDSGIQGDNITRQTKPTIDGTTEPGANVTVTFPTGETFSVKADANGNWSVTPTQILAEGLNNVIVTATDAAGNQSQPTVLSLFIDSVAPPVDKLAITGVLDDVGPVTGNVKDGGSTDDSHPAISGTGSAGDTVVVFAQDSTGKNHAIGSATVDADGKWSLKPALPLVSGLNVLTAVESDVAGNSTTSKTYSITLDMGKPAVPTIESVYDDVGVYQGFLQKNAVTDDNQPTFKGTAQAGLTVKLYDGKTLIGVTVADEHGNWTITTSKLADGPHEVTATSTSATGVVSDPTGVWPFSVDTATPPNVTDLVVTDNVGTETGPLKDGQTTDDSRPTFSGDATAKGKVIIYDNGKELGRADVGDDGKWVFVPSFPLDDGDHRFTTEVIDQAGNSSGQGNNLDVIVDTSKVVVSITTVIDDVAPITGNIPENGVTNDNRPEIQGTGKTGSIITLYDGDLRLGSTTVKADGTWTFTPAKDLADGPHGVTATATDKAGNSASTPAFLFSVDTIAPDKPSITSVTDDVGDVRGPVDNGGFTDDQTPTLAGKAEGGSIVTIYDNGEIIGSVTAYKNGDWSFTPSTSLAEIKHEFTVDATDKAGNTSAMSDKFIITVDFTDPTAPMIEHVIDNEGDVTGEVDSTKPIDDSRPLVSGTAAEGGLTIVLYNIVGSEKIIVGSTTTDAQGKWTLTSAQYKVPLYGAVKLVAEAFDKAGNESAPSNERDFTVLSDPPKVPTIKEVWNDDVTPHLNVQPNAYTNDNTALIKGTAESLVTVRVYNGDKLLGEVKANEVGQWQINLPAGSPDGEYDIYAIAVNAAGMTSPKAGPYTFFVDTVAPPKPDENQWEIYDDVGAEKGLITTGSTTDDEYPTVRSAAGVKLQEGFVVTVYDFDRVIGSTTVKPDGTWSLDVPAPQGDHDFSITVTDLAGNQGDKGNHITFDTDINPNEPTITGVYNDEGAVPLLIDRGGYTNDATPEVQGKAKAGSLIEVYDNTDTLVGTTTADTSGKWSLDASALTEGDHTLTVRAKDPAGNWSPKVSDYSLHIDLTAPVKPTIDYADDTVGTITGKLNDGAFTDDPNPVFHGTGEAGTTIHLYEVHGNGTRTEIGTATVAADNTWSIKPTAAYSLIGNPVTAYTFTAESVDKAGNVSDSNGFHLTVDFVAPTAPFIEHVIDNEGNVTGEVTSDVPTDDRQPLISGTAAEGDLTIVVYSLVQNQKIEVGRTTTDPDGKWTLTSAQYKFALDGAVKLVAEAFDKAGNESAPSNERDFTVLSDPPKVPTIKEVWNDDVTPPLNVQPNAYTNDNTALIKGTAQSLITVRVYNGDKLLGEVKANEVGQWQINLPAGSPDGEYDIYAIAVNAAGMTSPKAGPYTFFVDTVAPPKPDENQWEIYDDVGAEKGLITTGSTTDDEYPTVRSADGVKLQEGFVVTVYDFDRVIGSTTVKPDGTWSLDVPAPQGDHDFSITVTDLAGNQGDKGNHITFDTDINPNEPTITGVYNDEGAVPLLIDRGGYTNDATPEVQGRAKAGSLIEVYDNTDTLVGTTTADASGKWSLDASALTEGDHTLTVRAKDPAGNWSPKVSDYSLHIDLTAPVKPTIDYADDTVGTITGKLNDGAFTDDPNPVFHGTGEAGTTIHLYEVHGNGTRTEIGTATVAADNTWSIKPTAAYSLIGNPVTAYTFTAESVDKAGNVSDSNGFHLTVDFVPPAAPTITSVEDNDDPLHLITILPQGETNDTTPVIHGGGATKGDVIHVYEGSNVLGSVTVTRDDGTWSFEVPAAKALADGEHALIAKAQDAAGNMSGDSQPYPIIIDTIPPQGVEISVNDITQDNVVNLLESMSKQTITGGSSNTHIGDEIIVVVGDATFTTTVTGADGSWSLQLPPFALAYEADGFMREISVSVTTSDAAGNIATAEDVHAYQLRNELPNIEMRIDPVTENNVISSIEAKGDITLTGVVEGAREGDLIRVTVNGVIYRTSLDANGRWEQSVAGSELCAATDRIVDVMVRATDQWGNSVDGFITRLYVVDTQEEFLRIQSVGEMEATSVGLADDMNQVNPPSHPGESLRGTIKDVAAKPMDTAMNKDQHLLLGAFALADFVQPEMKFNRITEDNTINIKESTLPYLPVSGRLIGGAEGDPVRLVIGGKGYNTSVDAAGNWSISDVKTSDLIAGKGKLTASIFGVDENGATQLYSFDDFYQIDLDVPKTPSNAVAHDDFGPIQGDISNPGETDDATPTFTGTGQKAGDVIIIREGDVVIGSAIVRADGGWAIPVTDALSLGQHTFTIQGEDEAGNTSAPFSYVITVIADASLSVVVDDITNDNIINVAESKESVAVNGSTSGANQGDVVTLTVNNKTFTAMVGADGKWTTNVPGSDLVADLDHMVEAAITVQGRTAVADKSYEVDLTPPRAELRIDAVTGDGIVNSSEAGSSDNIVAGQVSGEFMVGDVVSFTLNGHAYSAAVDVNGKWSVTQVAGADLVAGAGVHAINATAVVHDAAGNATSLNASQPYVVDLRSLSVLIETIAGDNVINLVESQGKVAIKGTTSGTNEGDVVTLTINNKQFTTTVNAKGNWSTKIAGSVLVKDADHVVQAVVTAHGETARTDKDYTVDLSPPKAELIIETVAGDNIVNASEAGRNDNVVSGKVTGEFTVGDLVTFTLNGHAYSAAVDASGKWSAQNVAGADLAAGLGNARVISASVKLHDAAGNEGSASATHLYYVQTTLPTATLQIDTVAGDDIVSASEASRNDNVVSGKVTGEFTVGDLVTFTLNGHAYSAAVDATGNWSAQNVAGADLAAGLGNARVISASVKLHDAAGNEGSASATHLYYVQTTLPTATLQIDTVAGDNIVNASEAGRNDNVVSGKVTGEFTVGDLVTFILNGHAYSAAVDASGKWSAQNVAGADLAAGLGNARVISASVKLHDAAGNEGSASATHLYYVQTTLPAATLQIDTVAGDNVVDPSEATSTNLSVTGTSTGARAGDVVTLVINKQTYSTTVGADGKWVVTGVKGSDLLADSDRVVDGVLHATDIAGNFVDVRATQTYEIWSNSVRIAGMSKDSAIDLAHSTDFITADGTAGRGVYGTIGQALTGNQSVQVSFDGGANWTNAVTNGLDWAAVDTGAHYSNWSIQARIADAGVAQGVATAQNVTYLGSLGTAPSITSIPDATGGYTAAKASDGSEVKVSLVGTLAQAGDTLHVVWGNTTYDQVLTAGDILTGTVTARVPALQTTTQGALYDFKVTAQIVTQEGQISAPSAAVSVTGQGVSSYYSDSLEGTPYGNAYYGQGFSVTSNSSLTHMVRGDHNLSSLYITNPSGNYAQINFNQPASSFSFILSGLQNFVGGSRIVIYDANGYVLTQTYALRDGSGGIAESKYFSYTAPVGTEVSKVMVYSDGADVWGPNSVLGGLSISSLSFQSTTHTSGVVNGQTVLDRSWETYFDDNSNTSHVVSMSVDPMAYFAQGTAHVHGGAAMDTLKLTGANQVLDLRSLTGDNDQAKISSIEKFDITGTGNNTLKLSINDVLNLGETNMFQQDGKVQVMVDGNAGDKVELSGLHDHGASSVTWKNAGTATISGATYQVYNSSQLDAEVLIKQTVTATLV